MNTAVLHYSPFKLFSSISIMNKKAVLNQIYSLARLYKNNLENNNLLFIYGNIKNPEYIITNFLDSNFYHLTGVQLIKDLSAYEFYSGLLENKISINDFEIDTHTISKLSVLPQLLNITKSAKMIGEYNDIGSLLFTDKIAGNVHACLGFVKSKTDDNYYPNTALKADIRNITKHPQKRVLAILKKNIKSQYFTEICYVAKNIDLNTLPLSSSIKNMIDDNIKKLK